MQLYLPLAGIGNRRSERQIWRLHGGACHELDPLTPTPKRPCKLFTKKKSYAILFSLPMYQPRSRQTKERRLAGVLFHPQPETRGWAEEVFLFFFGCNSLKSPDSKKFMKTNESSFVFICFH
jgi:hypothetical protein